MCACERAKKLSIVFFVFLRTRRLPAYAKRGADAGIEHAQLAQS